MKRSFLTANDVVNRSNDILQNDIENLLGSFERKLVTLISIGGTDEEISNLTALSNQANNIHRRSNSLQNYYTELSDWLIQESQEPNIGKTNPNDPLGDRHYYITRDGCDNDYEHFGLLPLHHLEKLLDDETSGRLIVRDIERPEGGYIVDSLYSYNEMVCSAVANHLDHYGKEKYIDTDYFTLKSNSNKDIEEFYENLRNNIETCDARDSSILIEISSILSKPDYLESPTGNRPWMTANFNNATLISALLTLNTLRNDIILVEKMAIEHLNGRVQIMNFHSNTIEAFAYGNNNITKSDSLRIKVAMVAFDTTERFNVRYWIDDSSKQGEMYEFKSNSGSPQNIPIENKKTGMHTIYGELSVKVKGVEEWKSWEYSYFVP
ncbi:MAG: hypothetical protein ACI9N1_002561 [Flavobacteriales bacterium]